MWGEAERMRGGGLSPALTHPLGHTLGGVQGWEGMSSVQSSRPTQ